MLYMTSLFAQLIMLSISGRKLVEFDPVTWRKVGFSVNASEHIYPKPPPTIYIWENFKIWSIQFVVQYVWVSAKHCNISYLETIWVFPLEMITYVVTFLVKLWLTYFLIIQAKAENHAVCLVQSNRWMNSSCFYLSEGKTFDTYSDVIG